MIVFVALLFVLFGCISLIFYGRKNYGILEKCGIPVVKPTLFLGSVPDFHAKVHHIEDIKRFKKYGSVWGVSTTNFRNGTSFVYRYLFFTFFYKVYEGQDPQIHIADAELARLIFVKDFDYFHNRRHMDFGSNVFNEILDYLPGINYTNNY